MVSLSTKRFLTTSSPATLSIGSPQPSATMEPAAANRHLSPMLSPIRKASITPEDRNDQPTDDLCSKLRCITNIQHAKRAVDTRQPSIQFIDTRDGEQPSTPHSACPTKLRGIANVRPVTELKRRPVDTHCRASTESVSPGNGKQPSTPNSARPPKRPRSIPNFQSEFQKLAHAKKQAAAAVLEARRAHQVALKASARVLQQERALYASMCRHAKHQAESKHQQLLRCFQQHERNREVMNQEYNNMQSACGGTTPQGEHPGPVSDSESSN